MKPTPLLSFLSRWSEQPFWAQRELADQTAALLRAAGLPVLQPAAVAPGKRPARSGRPARRSR